MPKVFVSYAWENETNLFAKHLSEQLRRDGIHVILDQWDLIPGASITHFMESSIRDSDFVLIICTPTYKLKSDARRGGVGYEENIITSEILYKKNTSKFIPILINGEWCDSAPASLLGKLYIDLSNMSSALADEYNYLRLLSVIHNVRINPPPVGTAPVQRIMTALSSSHNDEYAKQLKITKQEETSLYRKHTTIPKTLSVHEVMECLKKANTVAECKIADYNLTTFTSARDKGIIETYLFNGDQRQRNYAALYMKRKGLNDILKKAFEAGKIDRVQAFSR